MSNPNWMNRVTQFNVVFLYTLVKGSGHIDSVISWRTPRQEPASLKTPHEHAPVYPVIPCGAGRVRREGIVGPVQEHIVSVQPLWCRAARLIGG